MLSRFYMLYSSLEHTLILLSYLCLRQSSGNGFQRQMFPFLWVPELCPCLSHRKSWLTHQPSINNWTSSPPSFRWQPLRTGRLLLILVVASVPSSIASALTAQRTPPQAAPQLLRHAAIARTVQRTPIPTVLLLRAWRLWRSLGHGRC
jgi:hypothetical protein